MKESWFFETLYPDVKIGIQVKENLYSTKTKFQNMKILETRRFGKILVLNGVIQTTTKDEFIYHEMISHIPLFSHPKPENVLIIGGGDGGVLREVLKHRTVKKVILVEIDKNVIENSQKYLPQICKNSFRSKKLKLIIKDGAEFVKNDSNSYDIIIIDSPDPIGPAKALFKDSFYQNLSKLLKRRGILVRQSGSSFLQTEEFREINKKLKQYFKYVKVYTASIPTYIGGLFNFIFCSQKINPQKLNQNLLQRKYIALNLKTKYYNPQIHISSFKLPNYIKEIIGEK